MICGGPGTGESPDSCLIVADLCGIDSEVNADFIAHARTDLPAVAQELLTARETNTRLNRVCSALEGALAQARAHPNSKLDRAIMAGWRLCERHYGFPGLPRLEVPRALLGGGDALD
jgi:hypothetical protein